MSSKRGSRRKSSSRSKGVLSYATSTIPKVKSLFYNRTYLYFISLFSILYFLGKAINHEYITLIVFMVISMFTYETYTKNMAIVLTISCIASILMSSVYITASTAYNTTSRYTREGLVSKEVDVDDDDNPVPTQPSKADNKPRKKQTENLTPLQPASFQKKARW